MIVALIDVRRKWSPRPSCSRRCSSSARRRSGSTFRSRGGPTSPSSGSPLNKLEAAPCKLLCTCHYFPLPHRDTQRTLRSPLWSRGTVKRICSSTAFRRCGNACSNLVVQSCQQQPGVGNNPPYFCVDWSKLVVVAQFRSLDTFRRCDNSPFSESSFRMACRRCLATDGSDASFPGCHCCTLPRTRSKQSTATFRNPELGTSRKGGNHYNSHVTSRRTRRKNIARWTVTWRIFPRRTCSRHFYHYSIFLAFYNLHR